MINFQELYFLSKHTSWTTKGLKKSLNLISDSKTSCLIIFYSPNNIF